MSSDCPHEITGFDMVRLAFHCRTCGAVKHLHSSDANKDEWISREQLLARMAADDAKEKANE